MGGIHKKAKPMKRKSTPKKAKRKPMKKRGY